MARGAPDKHQVPRMKRSRPILKKRPIKQKQIQKAKPSLIYLKE